MTDKRLWPYKLAICILYGYLPGIDRVTADRVVINIPLLATHLGLSSHRLRTYLTDLSAIDVITSLSFGHGWARLEIAPPIDMMAIPETIDV
jgi:hypothetical protein